MIALLFIFPNTLVIVSTPQKTHKKNNSSLVLGSRSNNRKLFWFTRFFTTFRKSKKVSKVKVIKKKKGVKKAKQNNENNKRFQTQKASEKTQKEVEKRKKGKMEEKNKTGLRPVSRML